MSTYNESGKGRNNNGSPPINHNNNQKGAIAELKANAFTSLV